VSVPKECVLGLLNLSAKQCDWLSHARLAPFPFPLFLFPAEHPSGELKNPGVEFCSL